MRFFSCVLGGHRRIISILVAIMLAICLIHTNILIAQAGDHNEAETEGEEGEGTPAPTMATVNRTADGSVILEYLLYEDDAVSDYEMEFFNAQIERFNAKYKGQFFMESKYIKYDEYIALLSESLANAEHDKPSETLPLFFKLIGEDELVLGLKESGLLLDLKQYVTTIPEFIDLSIPASRERNYNSLGQLCAFPQTTIKPIGLYYNSHLLLEAGLQTLPLNWDQFMDMCDSLVFKGIAPLSMMTAEDCWTTVILASAILGSKPAGYALMSVDGPVIDYSNEVWTETIATIQRFLQYYGVDEHIAGPYAQAAEDFYTGKTMMFPNGQWMIETFDTRAPANFKNHVTLRDFPGKVALGTYDGYGMSISTFAAPEHYLGYVEYMRFLNTADEFAGALMVNGGYAPRVPITKDENPYAYYLDPLRAEFYEDLYTDMRYFAPTLYDKLPQDVLNIFLQNLPRLATGELTPELFVEAMQAAAPQVEAAENESEH